MPQLLLELFSEEIPARMQAQAARDLERMAAERLRAQELPFEAIRSFAGPRRLTLVVDGLPAATPDRAEELKGPKASAPPQALEGFLRKTGLAREDLIERDGVLFAVIARAGRPTPQIAAEVVGEIVRGFPWPKSMRSGSSTFRWVRPLKRILCLFDGAVVPFEVDGVVAGDLTEGHRFMGPKTSRPGAPFAVTGFNDYAAKLEAAYVVLDAGERRRRIAEGAAAVCAAEGLEVVPDEGLLDEVAGLAEWPVPVLGRTDAGFLDLPPEVIKTSMRTHQKYFSVRRPSDTVLAPRFVVVANVEAGDGGALLAAGNARVLSARLNDARFFWDEDRKAGAFERWAEKLKGVTFHAKLGTLAERVERIAALAREIAPAVGADPDLAERAARLAKLDLASAMVGEFPELQGVMGGYYARALPLDGGGLGGGGDPTLERGMGATPADLGVATPIPNPSPIKAEGSRVVADAVRDHYKPVGPSDSVPTAPVTVAVALADKLDTLVGFFAIDEKPTGSKDPFALRRAALGVIRLVLANGVRTSIITGPHLNTMVAGIAEAISRARVNAEATAAASILPHLSSQLGASATAEVLIGAADHDAVAAQVIKGAKELPGFFADRLKVQLRDEGRRHDLVDAVFALGDDDLVRITARVEALSSFLATEDGANLLAGYKRAVNILRAEAKKHPGEVVSPLPLDGGEAGRGGGDSTLEEGKPNPDLGVVTPIPGPPPIEGEGGPRSGGEEEPELKRVLAAVQAELEPALAAEDFSGAMGSLARLRAPVDAFFEHVLVNDPDPAVRLARLRLLASIRDAANRVADFSLIQS